MVQAFSGGPLPVCMVSLPDFHGLARAKMQSFICIVMIPALLLTYYCIAAETVLRCLFYNLMPRTIISCRP